MTIKWYNMDIFNWLVLPNRAASIGSHQGYILQTGHAISEAAMAVAWWRPCLRWSKRIPIQVHCGTSWLLSATARKKRDPTLRLSKDSMEVDISS